MEGLVGSVFFDTKFGFHDGEVAKKLFVVIGCSGSSYLVVKTTSKQKGREFEFGCQVRKRPCFSLPKGSCWFKEHTWVCLNEFYELSALEFLQKSAAGTLNKNAVLPDDLTLEIQKCALESPDISGYQTELVEEVMR